MAPFTSDLSSFKSLLLETCGLNFENTREKTLLTALQQRLSHTGNNALDAYYELLKCDSGEFNRLVELLTVNETYFFREPAYLKLVVDCLLPELLAEHGNRRLTILSAGCSTGEEPYSIAMMLQERFGTESSRLFSVSGVDIDTAVIGTAKAGEYGKGSFRGVDQAVTSRYFEACGSGRLRIRDEVKDLVTFEVVNLLSGVYPPSMLAADVIFYRNVSIYFPNQVQRSIFSKLADLLHEGGYLIVGASETIHHDTGILTLVERDALYLYKKMLVPPNEDRRGEKRAQIRREQPKPAPVSAAETAKQALHEKNSLAVERPRRTAETKAVAMPPASSAIPDVTELFDQALELTGSGRMTDALAVLEKVTSLDDTFVRAHTLAGNILLTSSRLEEARAACEKAILHSPLCLEAYLMLGIVGRQEGDDDKAYKRFREAIYISPSCWLAHVQMAEIAYAREDRRRAQSGYSTALSILEAGSIEEHGREFPPLVINADQFRVICRHKLSLLKEYG